MGKLEVRLLGPFETVVAGQPVVVPGAKRQALVAVWRCAQVGSCRRTRWSRRSGEASFRQRLETPCSTM